MDAVTTAFYMKVCRWTPAPSRSGRKIFMLANQDCCGLLDCQARGMWALNMMILFAVHFTRIPATCMMAYGLMY
jgi:hypothetical protein